MSMYDFSILRELRKREGLTIGDVSERSGISPAVISKLERNQTQAGLETLFRLSRVFGLNTADLVALAESRTAQKTAQINYERGKFSFKKIEYKNIRTMLGTAPRGTSHSSPEVHQDDYEICWVIEGEIIISLPDEKHILQKGDALQFDAILEHKYEVLQDCTIIIHHIPKEKRF